MTTIYDFSAQLGGAARPTQFRVHINFPTSLVSNGVAAKQAATFLTHQASLPNYTIEDTPVYYRGRVVHEAGEKSYSPWQCTIYNSNDFLIRDAIEQWANAIHDPEVVYGVSRPESYKGTIFIEQLDREGNTLKVYKLVGAFPTDTGQIDLSYNSSSEVETFNVSFTYDYFVVGESNLLTSAQG